MYNKFQFGMKADVCPALGSPTPPRPRASMRWGGGCCGSSLGLLLSFLCAGRGEGTSDDSAAQTPATQERSPRRRRAEGLPCWLLPRGRRAGGSGRDPLAPPGGCVKRPRAPEHPGLQSAPRKGCEGAAARGSSSLRSPHLPETKGSYPPCPPPVRHDELTLLE